MILSICDSPNVLEIMNIVVTIIKVIITVVPIILLFSLIFKAVSAATQGKEDALAELKKKAVPNIVAAVLIFLIPTLVSLIVTVSFPESDYTKCIAGISSEKIQEAYEDKAEKLVRTAEETLNINDYSAAMSYMPNVKDDDKRESYEKRLEEVKKLIDEARKPEDADIDINNIYSYIIFTGDSRIQAFNYIKDYLGFNGEREFVYARYNTRYDEFFESHMQSAESKVRENKDKTFAVTANYGANALRMPSSFCNRYETSVKRIGVNNQFYIVSVNPVNDNDSRWAKNDQIEKFNDYMINTCVDKIQNDVPGSQVFYCDVYGSLTIDEWISNNYIQDDGVHYTDEGNKYIYESIKRCVAKNERKG